MNLQYLLSYHLVEKGFEKSKTHVFRRRIGPQWWTTVEFGQIGTKLRLVNPAIGLRSDQIEEAYSEMSGFGDNGFGPSEVWTPFGLLNQRRRHWIHNNDLDDVLGTVDSALEAVETFAELDTLGEIIGSSQGRTSMRYIVYCIVANKDFEDLLASAKEKADRDDPELRDQFDRFHAGVRRCLASGDRA